MGGAKAIQKNFNSFLGKDLRSSDLIRNRDAAIDFDNMLISKSFDIEGREGGKIRGPNGQYLGLFNYSYSNTTTGATEEEILSVSNRLYKRRSNTFTITYTPGAATSVVVNITLDTTSRTFKCSIVEDGVSKLNYDLGTGQEAVPVTLANLKTQIDGISGGAYVATISGVTTIPAAFLALTVNKDARAAALVISYYDWVAINQTITNVFDNYFAARGNTDFEHASFCGFNDTTLIATGYNYLQKYDGQTIYRVGLPQPSAAITATLGGVGITGTYRYIYVYKQKDNRGNITEGRDSAVSTDYAPANQTATLTVQNILAGTGFNTNCGTVNGNQVGVTTITVNNTPHTLQIGDTAYFLDRSTGAYVERTITATAATTITVSGAAVNVNNGDVISNNLRIEIWRNKNGGTDYFLVKEIPNNSLAATQTYADATTDANLGAQYFFPFKRHDVLSNLPRYVITHQNVIVCDGGFLEPSTTYFSYTEDPECFPTATNAFDIPSTFVGGITGYISSDEHLIIGKRISLFIATGDLDGNAFRVEKSNEGAVGIECHNASADIGSGVMFLSARGWYLLNGGFNLMEIGYPMNKIFYELGLPDSETLRIKRSWGTFDDTREYYVCFIPQESGTGTARYANSNSSTYVFDAKNKAWYEWTGLNMGGGICVSEDALWWQSKKDDSGLTVTGTLSRRHDSGTENDFADHVDAINETFGSQWEDGSDPDAYKFIPRFRVYNLTRANFIVPFTITVKTEINYQTGITDSQLSYVFDNGDSSAGWGYLYWGTSPWGAAVTRIPVAKKLKNNKFHSLRFVFQNNTLHERMSISGWSYELIESYRREMVT